MLTDKYLSASYLCRINLCLLHSNLIRFIGEVSVFSLPIVCGKRKVLIVITRGAR